MCCSQVWFLMQYCSRRRSDSHWPCPGVGWICRAIVLHEDSMMNAIWIHLDSNPSVYKLLLQVSCNLNSSLGKSQFMHLLSILGEIIHLCLSVLGDGYLTHGRKETKKCFAAKCVHKAHRMQFIISILLCFFSIHLILVRCLLINGSCLSFSSARKKGNSSNLLFFWFVYCRY